MHLPLPRPCDLTTNEDGKVVPCVWVGGGGARVSSPAPAPPPATCSWSHYWSLHRARHNILIEGTRGALQLRQIMGATLRSTEH